MEEALRRFTEMRCVPMSLRERVVDGILLAALEQVPEVVANNAKFKSALTVYKSVGKCMSYLVPAGVVTRAQLEKGITDVMLLFNDLKTDFPKADQQLADMCTFGLVEGTLKADAKDNSKPEAGLPTHDAQAWASAGYINIGRIAVPVALKMYGVDAKKAGTLLPKEDDASEEPPAQAAAAASAPVVAAEAATPAPPAAPVAAPVIATADDDDDAPSTTLKKKKKKKAVVEEEDD
jgi:hypothetical protein